MARYIDADKFAERIKASPIFHNMGQDGYFLQEFILDLIDRQTDGFAPKNECYECADRTIKSIEVLQKALQTAREDVAREIIDNIASITANKPDEERYDTSYRIGYNQAMNTVLIGLVKLKHDLLRNKYTEIRAMADIKKVVWHRGYDEELFPFCPYCNEFAYEEDKCVFCGKPYEWVESPIKDTIVEVDGHRVVQTSGNHIHIYNKDGRLVCHMSCTAKKTEEELVELFKFYEELRKE